MKVINYFKKYVCRAAAFALTIVAAGVATSPCYFIFYQPKVPEGLKDFSKNK